MKRSDILKLVDIILSKIGHDKQKMEDVLNCAFQNFQKKDFIELKKSLQIYEDILATQLEKDKFQLVLDHTPNEDCGYTDLQNKIILLNLYNIDSLETLLVTFFHEQGHEMEPYLLEQDIKDNYFYHELQLCNDAMFDIRDLKMLGIRDFKNCYHYQPSELFADTYAYQMIHYYGFDNHLKANQIKKLLLDEKIDNDSLYRQMILYLIINEAELKNKTISEVYREFQLKKGKYQNVERKFIKKFICH